MSKIAKKPLLKRSVLSYAVALVTVGGFAQEAFADLCTVANNTVNSLNPADNCLLDAVNETLTVTGTGSIGQGVVVSATGVDITNQAGGSIYRWDTAIDYTVDLDGSLSNAGAIAASSTSAVAINLDEAIKSTGSIGNTGSIDANAGYWAAGINVNGRTDSTKVNAFSTSSNYAITAIDNGGQINNDGTISVNAGSWTAYGTGIYLNGIVAGDVVNTGSVAVDVGAGNYARASGIRVNGSLDNLQGQWTSNGVVGTSFTSHGTSAYDEVALATTGSIDNQGTISATAGATYYAEAYGVEVGGAVLGSISNSGDINVNASSPAYGAQATGINVSGGVVGWQYNWNYQSNTVAGDFHSTIDSAYTDTALGAGASLTNSGSIQVEAHNSSWYWNYSADAVGVNVNGVVQGSIDNTGTIIASATVNMPGATAYATGISLGGGQLNYAYHYTGNWDAAASVWSEAYSSDFNNVSIDSAGSLSNGGLISAAATAYTWSDSAYAAGVDISGTVLGQVSNTGDIVATAWADNGGDAYAKGLSIYGGWAGHYNYASKYDSAAGSYLAIDSNSTNANFVGLGTTASLTNSGKILATATANGSTADATAVSIDGAVLGAISNSGTIAATANGAESDATAVALNGGIVDNNWAYHFKDNLAGTYTTSGFTSYSYVGLGADASLVNTGTIEATANSSSAMAQGVAINGVVLGDIQNAAGATIMASASGYMFPAAVAVNLGGGVSGLHTAYYTHVGAGVASDSSSSAGSYVALGAGATLSNSGVIAASANASYYAFAGGVYAAGEVQGSITNDGVISANTDVWGYGTANGVTVGALYGNTEWNNSSSHRTATSTTGATALATTSSSWNTDDKSIGIAATGSLSNAGTIEANISAGYSAQAVDVQVGGAVMGAIDNSGTISASASGGGIMSATGVLVYGGNFYGGSGSWLANAKTVTGTVGSTLSNYAYSSVTHSEYVGLGAGASLTNSGKITADAQAGWYGGYATGVYVGGTILGAIDNQADGKIIVTADGADWEGRATGVYLSGGVTTDYNRVYGGMSVANHTGTALDTTTSTSTSWSTHTTTGAQYVGLGAAASLTNAGMIVAFAQASDNAVANGLDVDGMVLGTIDNSGTLSAGAIDGGYGAWATGANLYGGWMYGSTWQYGGGQQASNTTTIVSDATSTTTSTAGAYAYNTTTNATDYSQSIGLASGAALNNSGTISAQAVSYGGYASANALDIGGAVLGNIANAGTLSAAAQAWDDDAFAGGLYIGGGAINSSVYGGMHTGSGTGSSVTFNSSVTAGSTTTAVATYSSDYTNQAHASTAYDAHHSQVGLGAGASLANSGTISVVAQAAYSATATGVSIGGQVLGAISNAGTLSVVAEADHKDAQAMGLIVYGGDVTNEHHTHVYAYNDSGSSNTSSTTVTTSLATVTTTNYLTVSNTAYSTHNAWANSGMSDVALGAAASLTNTGSIAVSADLNDPYWYWSSADAIGVVLDGEVAGAVTNAADASISADAQANGHWASATAVVVGYSTNTSQTGSLDYSHSYGGVVSGASDNGAVAMSTGASNWSSAWNYAYSNLALSSEVALGAGASFTNQGSISATAQGAYNGAGATGVDFYYGSIDGTIANSGSIAAVAQSNGYDAYASGLYIDGGVATSTLGQNSYGGTKSGSSSVDHIAGTSQTAVETASNHTWASAYSAVYASIGAGATLTNSGSISATAVGYYSYGGATGVDLDDPIMGALVNTSTGSITASATMGSDANAVGLTAGGHGGTYSYGGSGTWQGAGSGTGSYATGTALNSSTYQWASTSHTNWAYQNADLALGTNASLTNAGTISAIAVAKGTGTEPYEGTSATAAGVELSGAVLGTIDNSGTISASASAGWTGAWATGLSIAGGDLSSGTGSSDWMYGSSSTSSWISNIPLSNHTRIDYRSTSASTYHSTSADVAIGEGASLVNSGTISATAQSGGGYGYQYWWNNAAATGVEISGAVLGTIDNSGTVSAVASAHYGGIATGLEVYGGWVSDQVGANSDNNGSETRTWEQTGLIAHTSAQGTSHSSYNTHEASVAIGAAGALTNTGTISATASAVDHDGYSGNNADARALNLWGVVQGAVVNSGMVSASASSTGDNAFAGGVFMANGFVGHYGGTWSGAWTRNSAAVDTWQSDYTWSTDERNVSLDVGATFDNSGTIKAAATAEGSTATAIAMQIGSIAGTLTNTGDILATAKASEDAYAYGLIVNSGSYYTETGAGTESGQTYDWTSTDRGVSGSVVNAAGATIGAAAEASYSSASATALYVDGTVSGSIVNAGLVTASATAEYYRAQAEGLVLNGGWQASGNEVSEHGRNIAIEASGSVANSGVINAFAEAKYDTATATGVEVNGDIDGSFTNTGTVRASADTGYDANAYGMTIDGNVGGSITNSNAIAASANADGNYADAVALSLYGDVTGSISNTDGIGAYAGANRYAAATGIYISGDLSGSLSNSATIDAKADGKDGWVWAEGVEIGSLSGAGAFHNTGFVGVKGQSVNDWAGGYGVYVDRTMTDNAIVSNDAGGVISVEFSGVSGSATGIGTGMLHDNAQLVNAGTLNVALNGVLTTNGSYATVYGVRSEGLYESAQVVNSGTINVHQAGWSNAEVVGLDVGSVHDSAAVTNSGSIAVDAHVEVGDLTVTGLSVGSAYAGATINNSGTIVVKGTGNSYTDLYGTETGKVTAVGISLDSQMVDSALTNTNSIDVSAKAVDGYDAVAVAYGIKGGLVDGSSTITNAAGATINVDAKGASNSGYGIYVRALTNGATVNNAGTINVAAATGWGIYVAGGIDGVVTNSGTIGQGVHLGGNTALNNTGSITNANSLVGGNYTQGAGGMLIFPAVSATNYGKIAVGGTADFSAGNAVKVMVDANDSLANGDVLADVVDAGTLTATGFDVSDNTLFWTFTPTIDGNTLDLTANYLGARGVLAGTGYNLSASLASVIDGIIADGADGQYAALAAALNGAADGKAAAALLQGFIPALNGAAAQATRTANSGMDGLIDARITETGAASGDSLKNLGLWLKGYSGSATQKDTNAKVGYDVDSNGFVLGADANVTDNWLAGLAIGSVSSKAKDDPSEVTIKSTLLNLYGAYTIDARTSLDLNLGFGKNGYDSNRDTASGTAVASYNGSQYSLGAKVARNYKVADKRMFTPSVSLKYTNQSVDAYDESGAGIWNQSVRGSTLSSTALMADGKYAWTLDKGVLSAHLGLGLDSADDARATSSLENGPTYVTNGAENEPVVIGAGIGYNLVTKKGLEFTAAYDLESRKDFMAGNASLKFRMPF